MGLEKARLNLLLLSGISYEKGVRRQGKHSSALIKFDSESLVGQDPAGSEKVCETEVITQAVHPQFFRTEWAKLFMAI